MFNTNGKRLEHNSFHSGMNEECFSFVNCIFFGRQIFLNKKSSGSKKKN